MIEILALRGIGEIARGDDLAAIISAAMVHNEVMPRAGDILVVTSKIVSKAEGRGALLHDAEPSPEALRLGEVTGKDPRLVELVLREAQSVVRAAPGVLITRHRLGFVMANSGIDASNIGRGAFAADVLLLPLNPDRSAEQLATALRMPVIVSDSFGRPWRLGVVNVAIGAAGLCTLVDRRGDADRDGRVLEVTQVALADMIASAAGLVSGEAAEGLPVVIVRGVSAPAGDTGAVALLRPAAQDLFP